ncbi:MAG: carbon storage regulator [Pseudomonadota bacterium]
MLILTRKPGESFEIGGNIKVPVLEIRGKQVRIRIEAPSDVLILKVGQN